MAGDARTSESGDLFCNKCKNKVVSSVKCVACGNCYHPSCAKHSKFEIVDKQLIKCCDKVIDGDADDASDTGFFDAIDNIASKTDNKVDIHIFKYIIKQKDMLIFELNDKIKLLNKQLEALSLKNHEQKPVDSKTGDFVNTKNQQKSDNNLRPTTSNIVRSVKAKKNMISAQDVSEAIDEAKKHINVPSTIISNHNDSTDKINVNCDQEWQQVSSKGVKKRNRKLIVGNFSGTATVEGVDRTITLHVSNLKPNTSTDDLCEFLRQNFPEVTCSALTSRHPDLYSSFKVGISKTNYAKAMNASMWPNKACVRHFFQRKIVTQYQA